MSPAVEDRRPIHREQLAVLVRQTPLAAGATIVIAGVLAVALWVTSQVNRRTLVIWYGAVILAALTRVVVARYLKPRVTSSRRPVLLLNVCAGLASLSAMCWGAACILYLRPDRPTVFVLCILALGGTGSGAVGSLGAYLPALYVFLCVTLVPVVIVSAAHGGVVGWAITAIVTPYILAVFSFGRVSNRTMLEAIRLRFANEALVRELTIQKDRALEAREVAEQAVLAKSKFLAAASHDLRQPAHALSLFVGALKPCAGSDPGLAYIADRIEASSLALRALLDGLLDISRLDAGSIAPKMRPTPLLPVMRKVAAELSALATEKGLELRLVPTSVWARTDSEMLERILRNLVSNAVRYTPRGRVLMGCRRGAPLRLCVWDTGIGIPEDQTEEIFVEFRQLHNPERDRDMGLGLGLAIVRRLVTLLGHAVRVTSRPGRGSCFVIELERAAPESAVAVAATQESLPATSLEGRGVLVVDDDRLAREALNALLVSWGCAVHVAGSPDEAAELAAAHPDVSACVVDYRLRGQLTGLHAIHAIERELGRRIPAIIVTGDTAPERIRQAERTGYALLHKPVRPALLRSALDGLLGASEALGAPAATSGM